MIPKVSNERWSSGSLKRWVGMMVERRTWVVGDIAECICGSDIRLADLPVDVPSLRGRRRFWLGIPVHGEDGSSELSHLCYPGAEGADGRALHEPIEGAG